MTAAAIPADILRAVERWARVTSHWAMHGNPAPPGWRVSFASVSECVITFAPTGHFWSVPPAIALAWALLVETGAGPVDVGRCPACVVRGGRMEWRYTWSEPGWTNSAFADIANRNIDEDVAKAKREGFVTTHRHVSGVGPSKRAEMFAVRPCPACNGTGREIIPAERLLLDAASGDATARDRLLVHADYLCERVIHRTNGRDESAIGLLLAWALGPWSGESTDQGECNACHGRKRRMIRSHPGLSGTTAPYLADCPDCTGTGRQLGHPHTAEAVAWLDRLTDARQAAAEQVMPVVWEPPRYIPGVI